MNRSQNSLSFSAVFSTKRIRIQGVRGLLAASVLTLSVAGCSGKFGSGHQSASRLDSSGAGDAVTSLEKRKPQQVPAPSPTPSLIPSPSPSPVPRPSSPGSWPDSTNTGYKNAPGYPGHLTPYSGQAIQSNQTYSFIDYPGTLSIGANGAPVQNVTFIGCRFHGSGVGLALVLLYGDNITIDYSTFEPDAVASPVAYEQGYQYAIEGDGGWYTHIERLTVTHSELWGFANAVDVTGSSQLKPQVFRDNYLHDPRADGGFDHTDGIGTISAAGGNAYVTIAHNRIVGFGNTNAIAFQAGAYDHLTLTDNYLSGFGYTVSLGATGKATNVTFTGNVFGTDIAPAYGPLYGWSDAGGNVWKCNRVHVVPGTSWSTGGGSWWTPVAAEDGQFWVPTGAWMSPASATDHLGNSSCP